MKNYIKNEIDDEFQKRCKECHEEFAKMLNKSLVSLRERYEEEVIGGVAIIVMERAHRMFLSMQRDPQLQ